MCDISGCSKDRDPIHIDINLYDREVIANKYSSRFLEQTLEVKANLTI